MPYSYSKEVRDYILLRLLITTFYTEEIQCKVHSAFQHLNLP